MNTSTKLENVASAVAQAAALLQITSKLAMFL